MKMLNQALIALNVGLILSLFVGCYDGDDLVGKDAQSSFRPPQIGHAPDGGPWTT